MREPSPISIAATTVAGGALGLAAGLAVLAPQHRYIFSLPTSLPERLVGWLLDASHAARLPLGRGAMLLLAHALLGALAGALAGAALRLVRLHRRELLARPVPLGLIAAAVSTLAIAGIWVRRGIELRIVPLLAIGTLLCLWTVLVLTAVAPIGRWIRRRPRRAAWLAVPLLGILLVVPALSPRLDEAPAGVSPVRARRPLLLIGVDAVSWANLGPQIRAGGLRNFARLRSAGARGQLQSLSPLFSPVVWTTIVTGVSPEVHGIRHFALDGVPYTSNTRRAWALWEILPRFGQRSAFHFWWASWPAEPVDGRIVTDRFEQRALPSRVFPPEDTAALEAVADSARGRKPPLAFLLGPGGDRLGPAFEERHRVRLNVLRQFVERDEIVTELGLDALAGGRFDLVGVYLRGPDAAGHKFWKWHYRKLSPRFASWMYGASDPDQRILETVVERMNELIDRQVGRLVEAAGPQTNVVIVSDHGMHAARRFRPHAAGQSATETGNHHPSGLLLLAGPDIEPGAVVRAASVYDVFPTVLHLLGLPVPEGLHGRVLVEALTPEARRSRPVLRVDGFGSRRRATEAPIPTDLDQESLDRLRSLGYVVN